MNDRKLSSLSKAASIGLSKTVNFRSLQSLIEPPRIPPVDLESFRFASPAQTCWDNLQELVQSFENELDDEHQIGVKIASDNGGRIIFIESFSYMDPNIITFKGISQKGNPVRLIQNVSQLNFTLEVLPKGEKEERRRIRFEKR